MKVSHNGSQNPYRRNSYRENSKPSYYNAREQQKPSYNFIEQTKIRIVQDNLVSVSGLPMDFDDPNVLGDNQHFGRYGSVQKIIISTQGKHRTAFIQVYITYQKSRDAAFAIKALDGIKIKGRQITATFGTTKYCTYFLKSNECRNQKCFYLHAYDTKNELMDGVKNNMEFLDEKSEKIINNNLKHYIEKELEEILSKDEVSQFPTIAQTIQYLVEEQILNQQTVQNLRKEIEEENKKKQKQTQQNPKDSKNYSENEKSNRKPSEDEKQSYTSNRSNDQRDKTQREDEEDLVEITEVAPQLQENKNKKCHSLSTTSSPNKYEKLTEIQSQNIDKTIERRIIKQIMRTNIIFRSKMDFVTKISNNAKEENNKIKNYVRKYLLNQI